MVKIDDIKLNRLRNEIHFQFCTDFKNLVVKFNPMLLKIESQFNLFCMFYEQESQCLKLVLQNEIAERLNSADQRRDAAYRGLVDSVRMSLDHFNPFVVDSAKRLNLLFKWYNNLFGKSFDEETAAIENLSNELRGKFAVEVSTVGITAWVDELESHNRSFVLLMKECSKNNAGKVGLRIKNLRVEIDRFYFTMVERINALMLVENNSFYEQFICELNSHIGRYENKLMELVKKQELRKVV